MDELQQLTSQERLQAYELFIRGCTHLWGRDAQTLKRTFREAKAIEVMNQLIPLTIKDPYFLAHLNSYIIRKDMGKDLKVISTFVNSLSSGNGEPFSPGSKYTKPNLRLVSLAATQKLEPFLISRLVELGFTKFATDGYLNYGSHFATGLRTAVKKYLKYREANIQVLQGAKKAGMGRDIISVYRTMRMQPSDQAAAILRYRQKNKKIVFADSPFDFTGLDDLAIAEKVRAEKLPVLTTLGALPKKISPVIAVALLEQATGNQAVILKSLFEESGVLNDPEVMALFTEKISQAKTALDRVETLSKTSSEQVKKALESARAEKRKEQLGDVGKVFLHIDTSGSMQEAIETAKELGAVIAEMVQNPTENFQWGNFNTEGQVLDLPEEFVKDAFIHKLYGMIAGGGTNAFALYPHARHFGAEVDVFISDGDHNVESLAYNIRAFHEQNPQIPKPKAMVWIKINNGFSRSTLEQGYQTNNIPVAVVDPKTVTGSAWVMQSIRSAMLGAVAVVDEIMSTELLTLPEWYFSI